MVTITTQRPVGSISLLKDLIAPFIVVERNALRPIVKDVPLRRFKDPDLKLLTTGRASVTGAAKVPAVLNGRDVVETWVTTDPQPDRPNAEYLLID